MKKTKQACEEKIDKELEKRMIDFRQILQSEKKGRCEDINGDVYENLIDWLNSYALSYDNDGHYRAKKLLLSWGGPGDYFLFFEDGIIEYHFEEWFDGAKRELTRGMKNYETMAEVRDMLEV